VIFLVVMVIIVVIVDPSMFPWRRSSGKVFKLLPCFYQSEHSEHIDPLPQAAEESIEKIAESSKEGSQD